MDQHISNIPKINDGYYKLHTFAFVTSDSP